MVSPQPKTRETKAAPGGYFKVVVVRVTEKAVRGFSRILKAKSL